MLVFLKPSVDHLLRVVLVATITTSQGLVPMTILVGVVNLAIAAPWAIKEAMGDSTGLTRVVNLAMVAAPWAIKEAIGGSTSLTSLASGLMGVLEKDFVASPHVSISMSVKYVDGMAMELLLVGNEATYFLANVMSDLQVKMSINLLVPNALLRILNNAFNDQFEFKNKIELKYLFLGFSFVQVARLILTIQAFTF